MAETLRSADVITADSDSLKVPPHSLQAEQAVLGGLMLDNTAWDKVADRVTDEDFYRRDHRLIFNAIGELADALEKLPTNATVRYHLGMVYYQKGNKEKARQQLEMALNLDSSFDGAQEAKETLARM